MSDHPEEGIGTLARVHTPEDSNGDVVFERSAERPMGLWAEAGESLLRIVPLLGLDAPPTDELEDCRLRPFRFLSWNRPVTVPPASAD
ncbi:MULTISPECIES: hypothetical protein [Streptomyces]|uniref:hypothetical protein n=1 Tax=Streptomyces TaxID=1883 RepID=UPI0023B1DB8B|nr:hypothetical protein [Streptomyces sp. KA12]MDF0376127.1 hypothetical protein [Streptomyces sp. KA12]